MTLYGAFHNRGCINYSVIRYRFDCWSESCTISYNSSAQNLFEARKSIAISPPKYRQKCGMFSQDYGKEDKILTLHFDVEWASYGARCLLVDATALVRSSILELYIVYDQFLAVALHVSPGWHIEFPIDLRRRAKTCKTRRAEMTDPRSLWCTCDVITHVFTMTHVWRRGVGLLRRHCFWVAHPDRQTDRQTDSNALPSYFSPETRVINGQM